MTWSIRMSPVRHSQMQILCAAMSLFLLVGTVACASPASRQEIRNWIRLLESGDPVKSSSAATSLLASGDGRALEALLDALDPGQPDAVRVSVIAAFDIKGDDRATSHLIAAVEDKSDAVRRAAIAALQSIDTPRAVSLMREAAMDRNRPPQTRSQIITILGEMRAFATVPALIGLLSDPEESVQRAARAALERITLRSFESARGWNAWWEQRQEMSREEMLEELVQRQSDLIRTLTRLNEELYLTVLKDRKSREDPAPLVKALSESNSTKVQVYAIKELAPLKDKAAVTALLGALEYPEASVRQAAAEALGAQGDLSAAPELIRMLSDPIAPVRAAAAKSLGVLKAKEAVAPLCALLGDQAEDVAAAGAQALGEIGDASAVDPLIRAVRAPTTPPKVYERAAAALAKIGHPRAVPTFIDLLKSPADTVRQAAAAALGELRVESAIEALSSVALEDKNLLIRVWAVAALAKIGGPVALDVIVKALSDKDQAVAEQALLSLAQLADAKRATYETALDRLLKTKRYDLAETVLTRALDQFSAVPNHATDITALRSFIAQGLMAAQEWNRAKPHLEALVSLAPNDPEYVKYLAACLVELHDYDAALDLLSRARRTAPAQAEDWWNQTASAVERIAASKDAAPERIIAVVDALEKESAGLGGEATAARLRQLREKAREKLPAPDTPKDPSPPAPAPEPAK